MRDADQPIPAWAESLRQAEGLPVDYRAAVRDCIEPLAGWVQAWQAAHAGPVVIGINGAQGSGKTTLSRFLGNWLQQELKLDAMCLSLDDFYLAREQRADLARRVHPLLATRGVPGTHDVGCIERTLAELTTAGGPGAVSLPIFDKAADDRLPATDWIVVEAPVDVVLFEGWCVGARPQPDEALARPINALEADEDPEGIWRRYVNECLRTDYARLFSHLDALVMLRVPSFDKVFEWRSLQERKLRRRADAATGNAGHDLTGAGLQRFVRHYERLTRWMLATMPPHADVVIDIDDHHRMGGMTQRRDPL